MLRLFTTYNYCFLVNWITSGVVQDYRLKTSRTCLKRLLKNAGDLVAVAALVDEARSIDIADRCLNSEGVVNMRGGSGWTNKSDSWFCNFQIYY